MGDEGIVRMGLWGDEDRGYGDGRWGKDEID